MPSGYESRPNGSFTSGAVGRIVEGMIVITTPTGHIGARLAATLVARGADVRVVARDPSRLDDAVREGAEVVVGSHQDPAVIEAALAGASALFWLQPPDPSMPEPKVDYVERARPAAEAVVRHGVPRVVAVSTLGHGWPQPSGLLEAAMAMDALWQSTGVGYRALCPPFFLENLLHQAPALAAGTLSLPAPADRPLPTVATADIADAAADLLTREWEGQELVPVIGPDDLTPTGIAAVLSDVLGREIAYVQGTLEADRERFLSFGASPGFVDDYAQMCEAQAAGIYDPWVARTSERGATTLRDWAAQALA
jgi:uncharacterized protein YbjT (DUF2867 family)